MKKIGFKRKENYSEDKSSLRGGNNISSNKSIHELYDELEDIIANLEKVSLSRIELSEKEAMVAAYGEIRFDLDGKTMQVKNVNKTLALLELANN